MSRASTDSAAWPKLCDAIGVRVGARGVILTSDELEAWGGYAPCSNALDGLSRRRIDEQRHAKSCWKRILSIASQKGQATEADICEAGDAGADYIKLLASEGLKAFGCVPLMIGASQWILEAHRGLSDEPFSQADFDELMHCAEALQDAAAGAGARGRKRMESLCAELREAGRAYVVLGTQGEVLMLDAVAEGLLRTSNLMFDECRSEEGAAPFALHALVAAVLRQHAVTKSPAPATVQIAPSSGDGLVIEATRVSNDFEMIACGATAVVTLRVLSRPVRAIGLRQRFGLTAREAQIAARIASGADLPSTAATLGIAVGTARHHLKGVFAKTGARRQAELVALVRQHQEIQAGA